MNFAILPLCFSPRNDDGSLVSTRKPFFHDLENETLAQTLAIVWPWAPGVLLMIFIEKGFIAINYAYPLLLLNEFLILSLRCETEWEYTKIFFAQKKFFSLLHYKVYWLINHEFGGEKHNGNFLASNSS